MKGDPRPRWGWAPWGLALVLLALGFSIWEIFPPGIWHDDGVYVLLGRSLAHGDGLRYVGVVGDPLAPKFPPLYPLLLAGIWLIVPSFPENVPFLAGINLVLLAAAGGLFALFLRRVFRFSLGLALGVTLLAWLSPHLWHLALIPLSEPLFVLTLVGAMWAGARVEEEGSGRGSLGLFLVMAGLAVMTRTVGVAVLLAGVGALLVRKRRGGASAVFLASIVILLPWILWSHRAAGTLPAVLQDTLGPYGGWWLRQMARAPGEAVAFVAGNVVHLTARVLALLLPGVTGPVLWFGVLLLPVLGVGLREMGRRSWILPLTLLFSLGILLVWPFRDIRLVAPLQPFLVLATVLGFRALVRMGGSRAAFRRGAQTAGAAWAVLVVVMSSIWLATGRPAEPYHLRAQALVEAVRAVAEKTGPAAVVGAPELWAGLHLFTGRKVAPSAPFVPLVGGGTSWGTPQDQYLLWKEVGLTHILVEHGGRVHGEALDRLDALCPDGGVFLLDNRPGQFLVELGWDEACMNRVMGGSLPDAGQPVPDDR